MYTNTAATLRPDLHQVMEEARKRDNKFIGEQIYPAKPVKTKAGDYLKITRQSADLLGMVDDEKIKRAPKAEYQETDSSYEKDTYITVDRGMIEKIDDSTQNELRPTFDAESFAANNVMSRLRRGHEKRVADRLVSPTIWGTAAAGIVNYTYTLLTTVNFVRDLKVALAKLDKRGEAPNVAVMNREVWDLVQQSTLLRQYLYGNNAGNLQITEEAVAKAFGLDKILVGNASYSTAGKGGDTGDSTLGYIFPNTHIWVGEVQSGEFRAGGAGRTLYWEEDAASLFVAETYREENRRSDVVRVRNYDVLKEINPNCGTLISTSYSAS